MEDHMQEFEGRHVVITGGCGALGSAAVELLLGRGAVCHVPAFNEREAEAFDHRGHERIDLAVGLDLTDESAVQDYYADLPALYASLHIAGGFAMDPIAKTSLEDFRRMLDMNLTTCFLCCREAVKKIRAGGGKEGGRIVNVSAKPALTPAGGMLAYTTSKAGVASLTQCLAEEVRDERIWVNAVVPSIMDTPANREAMPDADHAKWPGVDDVARTIVFLASPQNHATRGALVPVYGQS
ncbi:MAG: SDR family NAD(P)-dependent oxidoreductase [Phycisphaerales bacterium]|nr:MAG: SDR family NAD(P)-dependent oxidoreductase [Phycisphaerales bacterium]